MVDGQYQILWQGMTAESLSFKAESHICILYWEPKIQSLLTFQAVQ
jgi:hypothetical protein